MRHLQKLCCALLLLVFVAAYGDSAPEGIEAPVGIATKTVTDQAQPPQFRVIDDVHRLLEGGTLDFTRQQIGEVDYILSGRLFPNVEGYLDVNYRSRDFDAEVEEAFAAIHPPIAGTGARLGAMLAPFGIVNQLQPHQFPFADNPTVIKNLLGDEFSGDGYEVLYTDPRGELHARLGQWTTRHEDGADPRLGAGFTDSFVLFHGSLSQARLADERTEAPGLKLGASWGYGPGEGTNLSLMGADLFWKKNLKNGRNFRLQMEGIRRRRQQARPGYQHEFGYYVMGIYQPAENLEVGARYDWSEVPYLFRTHETALSLFGTRHLGESNYLRLQLKRGMTPEKVAYNEVLVQLVYRFDGPVK